MASPEAVSTALVIVIVILMIVYAYFEFRKEWATLWSSFSGRTDPFWTPSMVDVPTRRFYDAACGPSGDSRAPWGATYWPPGCPAR